VLDKTDVNRFATCGRLAEHEPKNRARAARMYRFVTIVFFAMATFPAAAQAPTPSGVWLHDNKRIEIEITPCADRLCAKIVWFKWPNDAQGLPLTDLKNPDPTLRSRPLMGLTVLQDLRRTGENTWEDGKIYNPDDGAEYQAKMSIEGNGALRIRAYVLAPLFGHTLIWTRIR
jgi:uncharacterized protein (DUF2147 family)